VYKRRAWTVYFANNRIQKIMKIRLGLTPPTPVITSGHASDCSAVLCK